MGKPGPAAGFHKILHPQKRAVLRAFIQTHHVSNSCAQAGISREMHYHWLRTDPDYKDAFAEAREMAGDLLEDVATQRAIGTQEGWSDTLLIFLLKGAKPETYKERFEHTGKDGGPITTRELSTDARSARIAALMAKRNGQAVPVVPEEGSPS